MIRAFAIAAALLWVAPLAAQFGQQPASFDATPSTKMVPVSSGRALADSDVESITAFQAQRREQLARNEDNTFWKFSSPQPYHDAAVRVNAGSAGGSGVLVGTTGNVTLCVTNHHVVDQGGGRVAQTVTLHMQNGQTIQAEHLIATPREDVAVYAVRRTDLPCIAISATNAPDDEPIEVMGFGGPWHSKNSFRPYVANPVPTTKALAIDAPAISGDSGAGMIWKGLLVGVNWGADEQTRQWAGVDGGEGVGLVYPATSSADAKFLNRFLTQACGPFGCQPLIGRPGYLIPRGDQKWERQPLNPQQQFPGPEQFYPPPGGQQPPQQQPPNGGYTEPNVPDQQPTPPQQPGEPPSLDPPANAPACECDDERLIAIFEQIKKPGEKGPKGEPGPPGPKGEKGDPGEVTNEQIKDAVAAIYGQMKLDPSFKGPKGDPGKDAEIDMDALVAAVSERLGPHPAITIAIADGDRKVIIEEQTYEPGEPIVLDIKSLIRAALAQRQ